MNYTQALFLLIFLPVLLLIYLIAGKKQKWIVLLFGSLIFYFSVSKVLILYLFAVTLFTFIAGHGIRFYQEKSNGRQSGDNQADYKKKCKKSEHRILIVGIVCLVALLAYLKYTNFFIENINKIFTHTGSGFQFMTLAIAVPIGISYFTLEAIGYLTDIYWRKSDAEKNYAKLLLFFSYFPKVVEGPISTYSEMHEQLTAGKQPSLAHVRDGILRIFYGLFKKLVIADRLSLLVKEVFENYSKYQGVVIVVGAIACTIQLYMEFSGCMDIVIGASEMFGINLQENFRQPFFSKNAAEFWRRWHITLGRWLKTYVFFPVSTSVFVKKWNRFARKKVSRGVTRFVTTALCLFPVWLCNGIWHGARWNYIFYGMYYFVILLIGSLLEKREKDFITNRDHPVSAKLVSALLIFRTWIIIVVGELLFRANGVRDGLKMLRSMFTGLSFSAFTDGSLLNIKVTKAGWIIILIGCVVVAFVDIQKERGVRLRDSISKISLPVRWGLYIGLCVSVIIFGAFGSGYTVVDLIYAGF